MGNLHWDTILWNGTKDMAKVKKKVGRPPSKPPEPIPDTEKNIIATVVMTRKKTTTVEGAKA